MLFQQFVVEGLGCLSYLVGCPRAGRAVVVNPRRDVECYLEAARRNGVKITDVIDTHVHADHVSGAHELRHRVGADIHMGAGSPVEFPFTPLSPGDRTTIGTVAIEVLSTPGHTPHAISLAVSDLSRGDIPQLLLTGDLLFVGGVGRPDLAGEELLAEQIAYLYDSLHHQLGRFEDYIEVYPAHGAGSLCGSGLSAKPSSTLGYERRVNPYLQLDQVKFTALMRRERPPKPRNFDTIIATNRRGAELLDGLPTPHPLTAVQLDAARRDPGITLIDLREGSAFGGAHIPGSLNIGMSANAPTWLGSIVATDQKLVLIGNDMEQIEHAATAFHRVGFDRITGYHIGISEWILGGRDTGFLPQVSVHGLRRVMESYPDHRIIDIRRSDEWQAGHIEGAEHLPLPELIENGIEADPEDHVSLICGSGYRSNIAASHLKEQGMTHVYSIIGGMNAWRAAGLPVTG
jgi:glyoxylase-like metal-dependent hydrolase (beta-lactamase superfamily II)/rhodanese-related sulfurtransferase